MSDDIRQFKTIKKIFKKAKHASRGEEGYFEDLDLNTQVQRALYFVGEEGFFELKQEVYEYLNDPCSEFRVEAIRTLGGRNGLQLDEFKEEAYRIWLEDPCEFVKATAIDAWGGYYRGTKNPFTLKILYNILKSEANDISSRSSALYWFMHAVDEISSPSEGYNLLNFDGIKDQKEFTKSMDWGKINRIMQQYVPGWKM